MGNKKHNSHKSPYVLSLKYLVIIIQSDDFAWFARESKSFKYHKTRTT